MIFFAIIYYSFSGPIVCEQVSETECLTNYHEHEVEEDEPNCRIMMVCNLYSVWKFNNLSATQILCEINFWRIYSLIIEFHCPLWAGNTDRQVFLLSIFLLSYSLYYANYFAQTMLYFSFFADWKMPRCHTGL